MARWRGGHPRPLLLAGSSRGGGSWRRGHQRRQQCGTISRRCLRGVLAATVVRLQGKKRQTEKKINAPSSFASMYRKITLEETRHQLTYFYVALHRLPCTCQELWRRWGR